MPILNQGQENTKDILNKFIVVSGILKDAFLVEFRILDLTSGLPGTNLFPAPAGTFETISGTGGRFSKGSYFAFDVAADKGWTIDGAQTTGLYRIEWRWKVNDGDSFQSSIQDFDIIEIVAGFLGDSYIGITDLRGVGLPNPPTDSDIISSILEWQTFLERACRQWFVPKTLFLEVDGTDSDSIHFGVPVIGLDHVRVNDENEDLDEQFYRVYNATRYPDDRHNPRLKLFDDHHSHHDIFSGPHHHGRLAFIKGRQNQEIQGVFGYIEEDGSVPQLIKRALLKLVIEKLTNPVYVGAGTTPVAPPPPIIGLRLSEKTDGHEIKFAQPGAPLKPRAPGLAGMTDDPEILNIIRMFRAPMGIATPANHSIR